jgi:hypothetical protein
MAVAVIGSIALNTVHSPDYKVASGLKTPGFKHFWKRLELRTSQF